MAFWFVSAWCSYSPTHFGLSLKWIDSCRDTTVIFTVVVLPERFDMCYHTFAGCISKTTIIWSWLRPNPLFRVPPDHCMAPMKIGPCRGAFPRWHYNAASEKCEQFMFGGCRENLNNYLTKDECTNACYGSGICACILSCCYFVVVVWLIYCMCTVYMYFLIETKVSFWYNYWLLYLQQICNNSFIQRKLESSQRDSRNNKQ